MKKIAIAIDGPAASGKSTTAKLVAQRLGYLHLDTGAMYRAITFGVLNKGIAVASKKEVSVFAQTSSILLEPEGPRGNRIFLNGKDVTGDIRSREVTKNVSTISSYNEVRSVLVREQRKLASQGGIVLEGRDIGTVVLPEAEVKIYMVAAVTERARRRKKDLLTAGIQVEEEEVVKEIEERDRKDSTREVSPLKMAPDAIKVDTSNLTIEEQVEFIVQRAREVIAAGENE